MKSQAVIEGGGLPSGPRQHHRAKRTFMTPLLVTRIKCNKYLNDMESESISANLCNKKDLSVFYGDANSILCFSFKVLYEID